ncbi:MAG: polysaccharide biosynthesis/export family protein, partial [Candidatus Omnitrophota bacterium]
MNQRIKQIIGNKFNRIIGTSLVLIFSSLGMVYCYDSFQETNPNELESSAKYNYYLGQYYYTQGKYGDAEQYFQRSMDMIERRNSVLGQNKPGLKTKAGKTVSGSTGGMEYTIGEGDVLFVSVWQNEDLNQELIVRPDGRVSFPLIGDVPAAGMTITELDKEMTKKLKEFLKFPEVSITIRKIGGSKIVILGQVRAPGVYAVGGSGSILEAIALAGGMTRDAVGTSVVLIRGGLQNPRATKINVAKAQKGDFSQNIMLQPEDIIFVPSTTISDV